jgi:hypothetical protein
LVLLCYLCRMSRKSRNIKDAASLALLVVICAALWACQQVSSDENASRAAPKNEQDRAFELPDVARPAPPLDRAALLSAVAVAASAAASGSDVLERQRHLDGAIFQLRIRFGCKGPSNALRSETLGWDFDETKRRVRVRAMPTIDIGDERIRTLGASGFEAVEGFWIPHPWMLEASCPVAAGAAPSEDSPEKEASVKGEGDLPTNAPSAPREVGPHIGIAQFFSATDSRTQRRHSRAYDASKILPANEAISSSGWNLVLSGRLKSLGARGVIPCSTAKGPDRPPDCVISADFDSVWIENPETGEHLAEWGGS